MYWKSTTPDNLILDLYVSVLCFSLVHLDEGKYWTPNSAKLSGKTHRQVFTDTLSTIYGKLYNTARKQSPHKFT